jgi:hypothetical protein
MNDYYPHMLDGQYWDRLRSLSPDDVVSRSRCSLIRPAGYYALEVMGSTVWVDPQQEQFLSSEEINITLRTECALAVVSYLIEARNIPLGGRWVSEKDLQGGEMFFRGPHLFPVKSLERKFGKDGDRFLQAGEKCGGKYVPGADVSFQVIALPRIPVQVLLWLADEDFPARITFLFDATIEEHLSLDVIFGLVSELCFRLEEV